MTDRFNANTIDLYFLGIAIVIGGQTFSWNAGLVVGCWENLFAFFFIGLGYICLVLCLSEMTSALPFSGGVYGFIRATTGPYLGFIVGCCEAMQNIIYVSATAIPLAKMIVLACGLSDNFEPLFWILFYIISLGINIAGGQIFWKFNFTVGCVSMLLILIYIFGTIGYTDFEKYVTDSEAVADHTFDGNGMMKYLPLAAWFFIGVEYLPLCGRDCSEPKEQIPRAMTYCILTLIGTGLAIFLLTCSQYPGVDHLADKLLPLNTGYARMFHGTNRQVTWLAIPATFATGFGFMFSYGRQMSSMARSGLFPKAFKKATPFSNTPYVALLIGTLISFLIVIFSEYIIPSLQSQLFYLCCLASYLVYINAFIGYIIFSTKYTSVTRHFHNPFGIASAVYGILCFSVAFIAVIGFQEGEYVPIVLFVGILTLLSIYYYFFVMSTQQFSEEEQKALFTAYIINANVRIKKQRKNKKKRIGSRVSNTNNSSSNNLDARSTSNASEQSSSSRSQDYDGRGGGDSCHSSSFGRQSGIEEGIGEEEEEGGEEDDEEKGSVYSQPRSQIGGLGQHVTHQYLKHQAAHARQDSVFSQSSIHMSEHTTATGSSSTVATQAAVAAAAAGVATGTTTTTLHHLLDRTSSIHTEVLSTHRSGGNGSGPNSGRISSTGTSGGTTTLLGPHNPTTEGSSTTPTTATPLSPTIHPTTEEDTAAASSSASSSSSTTLFSAAIQQLFPNGFKMRSSMSASTATTTAAATAGFGDDLGSARISSRMITSGRYFSTGNNNNKGNSGSSSRISNLALPEEERISTSVRIKPIPVITTAAPSPATSGPAAFSAATTTSMATQYMPVEVIENTTTTPRPTGVSREHPYINTTAIIEAEKEAHNTHHPISPILLYAMNSSGTMMTSTGTMYPISSSTPASPTATAAPVITSTADTTAAPVGSSSFVHSPHAATYLTSRGNSTTNIATLQPVLETILHRPQSPQVSPQISPQQQQAQPQPQVMAVSTFAEEVSPESPEPMKESYREESLLPSPQQGISPVEDDMDSGDQV